MNPFLSGEIASRLRQFQIIDRQAASLKGIMIPNPESGFESESFVTIKSVEDTEFDFLITTMGVEIYAYYSKILRKVQNAFVPMGRIEFFQKNRDPRIVDVFDGENLLEIEFSANGNFQIFDDYLNCSPSRDRIGMTRDVIVTQVTEALHRKIFDDG
ncbi:hypothetical protein LK542_13380 [Massilia sp. IC2-477]|uniref:hypothetical protein n=1 Tax=Massilia sp. IC2-477 TaxID=2887198 RepID=UPI001D1287B3|nr:hypothetical protein [Massilia sp. IC2-477]MCC2956606.1 hypothetical protein [Massilia sp. IC2-477]